MSENELARQAAEAVDAAVDFPLMNHDRLLDSATFAIGAIYAPAMAELERLRRQVAFVKQESLLAIPSPWGSPSETRCLLCKNTWWHECPPNHAVDCPHSEVAT